MNDFDAFPIEFFFTNLTLKNINIETFLETRHFLRGLNVPAHDSFVLITWASSQGSGTPLSPEIRQTASKSHGLKYS